MTTTRPRRKSSAERAAHSREAQHTFWEERFAAAETPLELVQETWAMLRARLMQLERKAMARVERAAGSREELTEARQQLAEVRERITSICGDASAELARLADEINTKRR